MTYREQELFDYARRILLAGAWLIENGYGRLALLPYVYATGHWRCEFHIVGRPQKTAFRYSIANGPSYLGSHCGGSIRKDVGPEKLAKAIWMSVPDELKDACAGEASREMLEWVSELRFQLGLGRIPAAFGEYFGEQDSWQLMDFASNSNFLKIPAIPGYVQPGQENSVLDDAFWSKAERRAKRLAKCPEFSLSREALGNGSHVFEIANRLRRDMADADHFEAPRLLTAAIAALQSSSISRSKQTAEQGEAEVSTQPSVDPVSKRAARVLSMIHELHKAGYQRLRVACGWDVGGVVWRARLMPSSRVSDDGWSPISGTTRADYSTADGKTYFGWADAAGDDARSLANKFISRFPDLARETFGQDWGYAGWFSMILGLAEHGELPAFFGVEVDAPSSLPPQPLDNASAHDPDYISTTGFPLIANDELALSDLPKPGADYNEVSPFCLSFDGYKGGLIEPAECWAIAEKAQRVGLANCGMDAIRTLAFIHQRQIKNNSYCEDISSTHASMQIIGQAIEEIRRRLAG
jgi:hypothetical protein